MKRSIVFLICAMGLVLSLACGAGGGGGIDCPDGLEPHRANQRYHGYTFDISPDEVNAINHDEASWNRCGTGVQLTILNYKDVLCTAGGWITYLWDGNPTWVCVAYHEDAPCCE